MALEVAHGALVAVIEHVERVDRVHHRLRVRVEDRQVEAVRHREREEGDVQNLALRQAERDVRHAEHRLDAEALFDHRHGAQRLGRLGLLRADGEREAVDVDVLARDAVCLCRADDFLRQREALFRLRGDAAVVEREAHVHCNGRSCRLISDPL